jgi:hypothetical protein
MIASQALFWVVGFVVGAATVAMTGKGFVEERGRRLLPVVVLLAVLGGLVVGWALNAWNDYIHFTANGGGGGM